MSEHHHHHEGEAEDHEWTSFDEANGCAEGLQGTITGWNADAEARMVKAMITVGKWVEKEAGCLLGHIKTAVVDENGDGITLNLTDLENGVEHHGVLDPMEKVRFSFMSAVVDVDAHELRHRMFHAIDDTGLDYELDEHVECSCGCHDHHHHDEECHCHDHHHHHHDGECHCHDHDHGHHHHHDGECHCHEHHHDEEHHHGDCCCHGDEKPKKEKKSFLDRIRRK